MNNRTHDSHYGWTKKWGAGHNRWQWRVASPLLLDLDLPQAVTAAGRPGSEPIPPLQALLALLVPKLLGTGA